MKEEKRKRKKKKKRKKEIGKKKKKKKKKGTESQVYLLEMFQKSCFVLALYLPVRAFFFFLLNDSLNLSDFQ